MHEVGNLYTMMHGQKNIKLLKIMFFSFFFSNVALRTAFFGVIKQRLVVTHYRRSGTTYRSHIPGSRIHFCSWSWNKHFFFCFLTLQESLFYAWPLKMGPIVCTETSVRNYHYSLRYDPEEHSSFRLRGGSLES